MNELSSVGGSGSNLQPAKVSHEPGQATLGEILRRDLDESNAA
jgi:hypothetical protein